MAELPYLPLWTDAYLGDTTHLTTLEHGAYLLLLMAAWRARDNRLPDNDRLLARYAKLTPGQWARIKPIIANFFTIEDGFWTQGRLTEEANAVRRYRQSQSDKGKASALKRKDRHSTAVKSGSNREATPIPIPNIEDTDVSSPPVSPTPKSKPNDWPCPDWCDAKVWADLKKNRRTKRLTNTGTAYDAFVADVLAMSSDEWPPGRLVEAIVARGWGGAYDPRKDRNCTDARSNHRPHNDSRDGLQRWADEKLGLGEA